MGTLASYAQSDARRLPLRTTTSSQAASRSREAHHARSVSRPERLSKR